MMYAKHRTALVLIHGLFGELSNWKKVEAAFSQEYAIFTPQLPIFEGSHLHGPLEGLVDFMEDYLSRNKIEDTILVGNSLGGHIALMLYLRNPGRVKALVLTGSSGLYEYTFGGSFPRINDYEYIASKIYEVFHQKEVVDPSLVGNVFSTVSDRRKVLAIIRLVRDTKKKNLKNRLGEIAVPVQLIWGMQDTITPVSVAEEFYYSISGARLCLINDCGHVPMMEQPETFNEILAEFLLSQQLASA
jgi:pimeloyl-ACP methyl ester carboxylesterase